MRIPDGMGYICSTGDVEDARCMMTLDMIYFKMPKTILKMLMRQTLTINKLIKEMHWNPAFMITCALSILSEKETIKSDRKYIQTIISLK